MIKGSYAFNIEGRTFRSIFSQYTLCNLEVLQAIKPNLTVLSGGSRPNPPATGWSRWDTITGSCCMCLSWCTGSDLGAAGPELFCGSTEGYYGSCKLSAEPLLLASSTPEASLHSPGLHVAHSAPSFS